MIMLFSLVVNMIIIIEARKHVQLKRIWPLMAAGLAGIPVGAWVLAVMNVSMMKTGIGIMVTVFALSVLFNIRKEIESEKWAMIPVGLFSGFLHGSITIGGPPVILFLSNQGLCKCDFRASLVAYFLSLGLLSLPVYLAGGLLTGELAMRALIQLPALGMGAWCGIILSRYLPENVFRKIVLVIVIISGLMVIGSGLGVV